MKSDGIYVKYLDKDCNKLLFRKAMIDGRLFLAITNEKKVLAIKILGRYKYGDVQPRSMSCLGQGW